VPVWRLAKAEHAPGLDGKGARLWGGRWNSPGVAMVYTASSLSLALLEVLVHLSPQMRRARAFPPLVAVPMDLPEGLAERLDPADPTSLTATQSLGHDWAQSPSSLAQRVPNLVIPKDWTLLINPAHPDIVQVRVVQIKPFRFGDRLGN
jgi:RES domain-containing protein